jgi:hypothetical protein
MRASQSRTHPSKRREGGGSLSGLGKRTMTRKLSTRGIGNGAIKGLTSVTRTGHGWRFTEVLIQIV